MKKCFYFTNTGLVFPADLSWLRENGVFQLNWVQGLVLPPLGLNPDFVINHRQVGLRFLEIHLAHLGGRRWCHWHPLQHATGVLLHNVRTALCSSATTLFYEEEDATRAKASC